MATWLARSLGVPAAVLFVIIVVVQGGGVRIPVDGTADDERAQLHMFVLANLLTMLLECYVGHGLNNQTVWLFIGRHRPPAMSGPNGGGGRRFRRWTNSRRADCPSNPFRRDARATAGPLGSGAGTDADAASDVGGPRRKPMRFLLILVPPRRGGGPVVYPAAFLLKVVRCAHRANALVPPGPAAWACFRSTGIITNAVRSPRTATAAHRRAALPGIDWNLPGQPPCWSHCDSGVS
jgi:hypothetical protein